ncbi:hypothetical protein MRB53_035697 [Persea americana]|uniref:Uncharacterized protein n=1 Tax=Persea americana TaxID=3435 RepID=A0ACC2K5D7_PERAE|nr:hypothetical protein MRB53_035697 [Persea americana]
MVLYPGTYMYAWPPHGVTPYQTLMPPPLYWYPYNPHPPIEEYQMNPNWALTMSTPNSQSSLEAPHGRLSAPLPEDLYPTQEELRSYWTVNTEYQGMEEQPMNMEVPTTTSEQSKSPP